MSGLSWKIWGGAFFASLVVHAGVMSSMRVPSDASGGGGGPQVSIAGSLQGLLGGVVGGSMAEPVVARRVVSRPVEAALPVQRAPRPVEVAPQRARAVTPRRAGRAVHASAAPVVPQAVEQLPAAAPEAVREVPPDATRSPPPVPAARPEPPVAAKRSPSVVREAVGRPERVRRRKDAERSERARAQKRRSRAERAAGTAARAGSRRQGAGGASRSGGPRPQGAAAGAVRSYGARVRARILANRPSAGGVGRAVVSFGLSGAGGLRFVRLARSSGNASLDRAAISAVRRSQPFPQPPRGARAAQLTFSISFNFR
jgi:protein TonB